MQRALLRKWLASALASKAVILFLVPLILSIQLIYSGILLANFPYDGMDWRLINGTVEYVDDEGPAVGALEEHDAILAINTQPPELTLPLYSGLHYGDVVAYVVNRSGAELQAKVTLIRPPLRIVLQRLAPLAVSAAFLGLGTFHLLLDLKRTESFWFFVWIMTISAILIFGSVSAIGPRWYSLVFNVLLWLIGPITVHFHMKFAQPVSNSVFLKGLLVGLYCSAAPAIIAYLALGVEAVRESLILEGLYIGGRLHLVISLVATFGILAISGVRSSRASEGKRYRLIALGTSIAVLAILFLNLLPDVLGGTVAVPNQVAFLFMIAIPIGYSNGILGNMFQTIEHRLRAGSATLLTVILLVGIFLTVNFAAEEILSIEHAEHPWIRLALALATGMVYGTVRPRIQHFVDWAYIGSPSNYQQMADMLTLRASRARSPEDLEDLVTDDLQELLNAESSSLWLRDSTGSISRFSHSDKGSRSKKGLVTPTFPADGPVANYLSEHARPVQGSRIQSAMRRRPLLPSERELLSESKDEVWMPVRLGGTLSGLILLGRRRSGAAYSADELGLLSIVGRQIASVAERLDLFRELELRLEESSRLHLELTRARERERSKVARELHDHVVQGLIGLKFKISQILDAEGASIQQDIQSIVQGIRKTIKDLRPAALDSLGLVPAIQQSVRSFSEAHADHIDIRFGLEGDHSAHLPEPISTCIYRVLQECLANIHRHANATFVEVELILNKAEVKFTIKDNGGGFKLPPRLSDFMRENHFGLVGIQEQVQQLGGSLHIVSSPASGTEVRIQVPYSEE